MTMTIISAEKLFTRNSQKVEIQTKYNTGDGAFKRIGCGSRLASSIAQRRSSPPHPRPNSLFNHSSPSLHLNNANCSARLRDHGISHSHCHSIPLVDSDSHKHNAATTMVVELTTWLGFSLRYLAINGAVRSNAKLEKSSFGRSLSSELAFRHHQPITKELNLLLEMAIRTLMVITRYILEESYDDEEVLRADKDNAKRMTNLLKLELINTEI